MNVSPVNLLTGDFMFRDEIVTGEIYHIYNRGVDKRVIFHGYEDYSRFVKSMVFFNTDICQSGTTFQKRVQNSSEHQIVEIMGWCLMSNHYHLILRQLKDGGIARFMKSLGVGYTRYFNVKYERSGHLFQGAYKRVHVGYDAYLEQLLRYVHLNPLSIAGLDWKKGVPVDSHSASRVLNTYCWSSLFHLENENFLSCLHAVKRFWLDREDHLLDLVNFGFD